MDEGDSIVDFVWANIRYKLIWIELNQFMIVPCGTYILLNRHLSDALLNLDFFVSEYIIDDTNYLVFHVEQTIKG